MRLRASLGAKKMKEVKDKYRWMREAEHDCKLVGEIFMAKIA